MLAANFLDSPRNLIIFGWDLWDGLGGVEFCYSWRKIVGSARGDALPGGERLVRSLALPGVGPVGVSWSLTSAPTDLR